MLTNLTLCDLIALRDYCHQESMAYPMSDNSEYVKWHERVKLVDKELSERVEKIFESNEA